jgi:unsaturated chondroitin disaccharide hydrolase
MLKIFLGKKLLFTFICLLSLFGSSCGLIDALKILQFATKQYSKLSSMVKNGKEYPSEGILSQNHRKYFDRTEWTAGFSPGILWQLYDHTRDDKWKQLAVKATDGLFEDQYIKNTHDVGFMIMCSYGHPFEFTNNQSYIRVIENAAKSLASKYSSKLAIESLSEKTFQKK